MIKLQVRVWKLTKMHDYFIVPPCIICTPYIICFRRDTSRIFGLWAFRKYILLCVSNVHNKVYALCALKQNICVFLYILMWNIFFLTYRWLVAIVKQNICVFLYILMWNIFFLTYRWLVAIVKWNWFKSHFNTIFFINVKKWNDNFLTCLEMFLLFWYAFLNLFFFFFKSLFSISHFKDYNWSSFFTW